MKTARDIIRKIKAQVKDEQQAAEMIQICEEIYTITLNVGPDQLIRAMLVISQFDYDEFVKIKNSGFYGDPRDVLMTAHSKNDSINYGIDKFK